jgi:hypothetical protein
MIITDIVPVITAIAAAIVALLGFYKKVIKPAVKAVIKTINTIEKMHEEFQPNGGGSLRDAINRIETRLLVEQQTRRALSMVMDVNVAIFERDAKGLYLWINQCYSNISGLSLAEAKNYGWINAIDPREREKVLNEWNSAIEQKRAFQMEYKIINIQTGIPTKVKCNSCPLHDEKEEIVGYVGTLTPIS